MASLDYAKAGVNRDAADSLVDRIATMARTTSNKQVKASVGGYASLYELDKKRWLAASTDGVGTKLKLAFLLGEHSTVGIDLVAMSVNDILCVGARPLFFLDYFATGKLDLGVAEQVLEGIVRGCKEAGCSLVGGETAEMPDFYAPGEYDLGGFAVGEVSPREVLPRKDIKRGDVLIGLPSSGAHSTGFSLLRKLLANEGINLDRARELMAPTKIYAKALLPVIQSGLVKGLAHITGSGFLNVPRMSEKVSYRIELPAPGDCPAIFEWIVRRSNLPLKELASTFNMGVGMVIVTSPQNAQKVLKKLRGESARVIGEVTARKRGESCQVTVIRPSGDGNEPDTAVLAY